MARCCDSKCVKCRPVGRGTALKGLGVSVFALVVWGGSKEQASSGRAGTAAPARPAPAPAGLVTARQLLAHGRLELDPRARHDLERNLVKPELLTLLGELLQHHRLAVSVFATGHRKCVAGSTSISHHWYGAAADIWKVDGALVNANNAAALSIVKGLIGRGEARPRQIGHPFAIPENSLDGVWTDYAHRDHLHLSTWTGPNQRADDCGGG